MAVFNKQNLLSELTDRTELVISNTQPFLRLTNEQLNEKVSQDAWSIAEVFEHLNKIHQIYIKDIVQKINGAADIEQKTNFNSGWLGDIVYEKTMPRPNGTVFKFRTPKLLHPGKNSLDGRNVLERFLQHQDTIHDIISHVSSKDLERIKIPFYFTRVLNLRLGDKLRFIIAHNERHLLQAQRMYARFC